MKNMENSKNAQYKERGNRYNSKRSIRFRENMNSLRNYKRNSENIKEVLREIFLNTSIK